MPTISYFYGIYVYIKPRSKEHPPPHVHARYQESQAAIDIQTGEILSGDLPKKAQRMVKEFVLLHKSDLMDMWENETYRQLPPLE